ncbi:MAG TPA: hypothetical protein DIW80_01885 [Gordonia polyisoprenivorans]|nr:hypothetical protein [Gordonia polyisoprenivorans]
MVSRLAGVRHPTAGFSVTTEDPKIATEVASPVFAEHELALRTTQPPLNFRLSVNEIGSLTFARIGYGTAVTIRSNGLSGKIGINMSQAGFVDFHTTSGSVRCGSENVWVLAEHEPSPPTARSGTSLSAFWYRPAPSKTMFGACSDEICTAT